MSSGVALLLPLIAIVGVVAAVTLAALLLGRVFRALAWLLRKIFRFVGREITDSLQLAGSLIAMGVFLPLTGMHTLLGRWSAARHYGRALESEILTAGRALYRVALANPLRFLCLGALVDGVEQRVPDAVARAPHADRPPRQERDAYPGYEIVGSLPTGGSGARLFIARPDAGRRAAFAHAGAAPVDYVVLKSFSLRDGSALPQIVRESRALEAAKRLGLVLDHDLNEDRFYYAMPYVPGDDLRVVSARMHAACGAEGLARPELSQVMSWTADLLLTLDRYHQGGLWHKDVKPENIVISEGRAHLVDLGLVTPLRSAMTLTTHGTEYFRDPELVRMAMRGAKVHEVDGVRFDLYGAGAVLFSALENSFPAHGGLSSITKRCPESLRWIVRKAMADLSGRYRNAREMLADLRVVMAADDPYALRPADLPSISGAAAPVTGPEAAPLPPRAASVAAGVAAASFAAAPDASAVGSPGGWGTGGARSRSGFGMMRRTMSDRIRTHRAARQARREARRAAVKADPARPNRGVFAAVVLFLVAIGGFLALGMDVRRHGGIEPFVEGKVAEWDRFFQQVSGPGGEGSSATTEAGARARIAGAARPFLFQDIDYWPVDPAGFHGLGRRRETGSVLVVSEMAPLTRSQTGWLDGLYASLREAGFDLHGDMTGETEDVLQAWRAMDYRAPLGQEAARSLAGFFDTRGAHYDAVLWIGRTEDERHLRSYAALRSGFDPWLLVQVLKQRVDG